MSLHFKRFFAIVSNSCYEFLYHKNPSLWWGNHDAKYRPTAFSIIAKSCSICWLSWEVLDFPAGDGRSTWRRSRVEIRAASVKVYSWRKMEATPQERAGWRRAVYVPWSNSKRLVFSHPKANKGWPHHESSSPFIRLLFMAFLSSMPIAADFLK